MYILFAVVLQLFLQKNVAGKGKLPAFKLAFELECDKFGICVVISLPSNGNLDIKIFELGRHWENVFMRQSSVPYILLLAAQLWLG